jgi:hypothetical protein
MHPFLTFISIFIITILIMRIGNWFITDSLRAYQLGYPDPASAFMGYVCYLIAIIFLVVSLYRFM